MPTATLLLTRPRAASERFHAELGAVGVSPPTVISPVLEIVPVPVTHIPDGAGLIFTSENGVAASGVTEGPAWVVGERTKQAAERAGLSVRHMAEDADALVAHLRARPPACPLIHLRGAHVRGDIARRLGTDERIVYLQEERRLSDEARALLAGSDPVILPLFSPRSAQLLAAQSGKPGARCLIVALSPAVAQAWPFPAEPLIASAKTGAAMIEATKNASQG